MDKPYGILRFKPEVRPVAIRYATKEARDKKAQEYADKDGYRVGLEEWMKPDMFSFHDWWVTGHVNPTPAPFANKVGRAYADEQARVSAELIEDHLRLTGLVQTAKDAAEGDSNDEELQALQEALDEALRQLGREDLR